MKEGRIQYAPTRPQYNDRRGVLNTPTVDKRNPVNPLIRVICDSDKKISTNKNTK